MRDDALRTLLSAANPWWQAAAAKASPTAWSSSHRLLQARDRHDLGYRSDILHDVATGPITDRLVVLTGPRRVGKSVVLLDNAAALCARPDLDPRQVVHIPCDEFTPQDLRRTLTVARELTKVVDRVEPRPRVWLLDEVTSTAGWTATVKWARDNTAFGDDTVIVTGSRWSHGEDITGNLLAGRAGTGLNRRIRHLCPMNFGAFLAATRPNLARPNRVHPAELQNPAVAAVLDEVAFDLDAYDFAWQDYLTAGGFPRAVYEQHHDGTVSDGYLRDLAGWLHRDLFDDNPNESLPLLLEALTMRSTSPLNITNTAHHLTYSADIFRRRLARLVASFAALWCPQRGDTGRAVPGSQAKLYLTDPVLHWLPHRLRAGCTPPEFTTLTEAALAVALARSVDDLDEGRWTTNDTIGYARTASGNEIDLAPIPVPTPSGPATTIPIESKWVNHGWRAEARTIEGKYQRGIMATKAILDCTHPTWAIPAPLLALLVG